MHSLHRLPSFVFALSLILPVAFQAEDNKAAKSRQLRESR